MATVGTTKPNNAHQHQVRHVCRTHSGVLQEKSCSQGSGCNRKFWLSVMDWAKGMWNLVILHFQDYYDCTGAGGREGKKISRQFILSSSQRFSKSGRRNLRNDVTTTPPASSPAPPEQSWQRGCVLPCFCAKPRGVSYAAKGEVLVKLLEAMLRYLLLYQPCRFGRKVANSWRQWLLKFPLTFPLHSDWACDYAGDGSCSVKSSPRKPSNVRPQLHSLHLLPLSKQVPLPEPLEHKRRKDIKKSFQLFSSEGDMPGQQRINYCWEQADRPLISQLPKSGETWMLGLDVYRSPQVHGSIDAPPLKAARGYTNCVTTPGLCVLEAVRREGFWGQ